MDAFEYSAGTELRARSLAVDLADEWITAFWDDQWHRLTLRGRNAYRAYVADWFFDDGLLEYGLRDAWPRALDTLLSPDQFARDVDHTARVDAGMTR